MTQTIFIKDFDGWISLKKNMDFLAKTPTINEGEIWWCGIGANVGVEIDGKSQRFSRPVLILKKMSKFGFMGIPLTSQKHEGSWYVEFEFLGKKEYAALCQARTMSVSRLYGIMGTIPMSDLRRVKDGFHRLFE